MLIRIKNTTFGLVVNGIVKPKTPADPPFDVADELAYRLVREGKAEIVDDVKASEDYSDDEGNAGEEGNGDSGFSIPKYDAATSKTDLKAIANEYGIAIAKTATKQELIKALDNFFADALPDSEE